MNNFYAASKDEEEEIKSDGTKTDAEVENTENNNSNNSFTPYSLLSWNIDGLDKSNLKTRFKAVCYNISE